MKVGPILRHFISLYSLTVLVGIPVTIVFYPLDIYGYDLIKKFLGISSLVMLAVAFAIVYWKSHLMPFMDEVARILRSGLDSMKSYLRPKILAVRSFFGSHRKLLIFIIILILLFTPLRIFINLILFGVIVSMIFNMAW
jgi:hypothetical protein